MPTPKHFDVANTPLESGITLLEASAGTGKTYSLTGIVVRLLLEEKVERVDEVLLVTFTNAATVELRNRMRALLRQSLEVAGGGDPGADPILQWVAGHASERAVRILRLALLQFDRVRVQTLHSFCAQLLRESAFEAGFTFDSEEAGDADALLRQSVEDQWRARMQEGGAWWPALAGVEGWSPADYIRDVRTHALHPGAAVVPPGPSLKEVDDAFASAIENLAEHFDLDQARTSLSDRKWKKDGTLDGDLVEQLLSDLEGTRDRASLTSVEAWLRLRASRIESSLHVREWRKLEAEPWLEPLRALDAACAEARHALRLDLLSAAAERFTRAKERAQRLDFDDLVERVRGALRDDATAATLGQSARQKIRVALIDEFQDTDLRQWEIFETLFGDGTMMLVGDPKQAIYGFRGADVYAYLHAMNRADRRYSLPRNHRSHPALVEAVNHLFAAGSDPFVVDRIEFAPAVPALQAQVRRLEGDARPTLLLHLLESADGKPLSRERATAGVLERLANEIHGLLSSGLSVDDADLHPGHLAVLVRTNHEGQQVAAALRGRGIQAVLAKMGDIHQSEAMVELALVLEAVLQPRDGRRARRAAATWLWGFDAEQIVRCREDESAGSELVLALENLRRQWLRDGFVAMTHALIGERDVVGRWLAHEAGERWLTDLRHSVEVLHAAALQHGLAPEGLLHWLWRERERDHQALEDRELRLERDERAVQILTMHGCKGLQYEVVFVPFGWWVSKPPANDALRFHGRDDRMILAWESAHDDASHRRHEAERLAEDMRLLYVALTRARRRCVLFEADAGAKEGSGTPHSATAFLLHRPERQDDEDEVAWVRRCVESMRATRATWRKQLEKLVRGTPQSGWLDDGAPPMAALPPALGELRAARARQASVATLDRLSPWQVASFTSLSRRVTRSEDERFADHLDPASLSPELNLTPEGIFAFARGARAGTCLHSVLERSDFTRAVDADDRIRIGQTLARFGLESADAHAAPVDPVEEAVALVERVRGERFPGADFTLGAIGAQSRRDEWAFRARLGRIDTGKLASLFARNGTGRVSDEAAPRLRAIRAQRLRGFLAGFVDLVFVHDGRWFVVDWKSNHLGNQVDDYAELPLWNAMLEHHYVLQYHLYVLALHRYLRLRKSDYDYDRHVGGVAYVFLRGLCGDPERGWFVDRPPRSLIEALDVYFDGEAAT